MIEINTFGTAWLLDRSGNCIDVYAHPSESFEFDSIVDVVAEHGSAEAKEACEKYRDDPSDALKIYILDQYNQNWCKVRAWWDNKLTFRITSTGFNWYQIIIDFLLAHPQFTSSKITVSSSLGRVYWDDVTYQYSIDPANEEILSSCFLSDELITL